MHVARRTLDLPPISHGGVRTQQRHPCGPRRRARDAVQRARTGAHPYAIGPTEITPARDAVFTRDDRISVAFQIVNAGADDNGKPDLAVNFRIVRLAGERESAVASLTPLSLRRDDAAAGIRCAPRSSRDRGDVGAARDAAARQLSAEDRGQRPHRRHGARRRHRLHRRRHATVTAGRGAAARAAVSPRCAARSGDPP